MNPKPISHVYNKYFQKSKVFLYPLLNFKKTVFKDVKTYIAWPGHYTIENRKLICVYPLNIAHPAMKRLILHHPLVEASYANNDETVIVYDMQEFTLPWSMFLEGKYSCFDLTSKQKIVDYFGITTAEAPFIQSFLFPSSYYKIYSELLNVDVSLLESVGELCTKYDLTKETYNKIII